MKLSQCRGGHPGAMGTRKLYQAFPMSGWPAAGWERANSMWLAACGGGHPGNGNVQTLSSFPYVGVAILRMGTYKLYVAGSLSGWLSKGDGNVQTLCGWLLVGLWGGVKTAFPQKYRGSKSGRFTSRFVYGLDVFHALMCNRFGGGEEPSYHADLRILQGLQFPQGCGGGLLVCREA